MVIFNSYVELPEGIINQLNQLMFIRNDKQS